MGYRAIQALGESIVSLPPIAQKESQEPPEVSRSVDPGGFLCIYTENRMSA